MGAVLADLLFFDSVTLFSDAYNPRAVFGPPHTYAKVEDKKATVEGPVVTSEEKKVS